MKPLMRILVQCEEAITVGQIAEGVLRVIPITGGVFEADGFCGTVLNVGADWNVTRADGSAHAYARYLLKTQDGAVIQIENEGILTGQEGGFATTPKFAADANGPYAWLNTGVYAGTLKASQDPRCSVEITVFQL